MRNLDLQKLRDLPIEAVAMWLGLEVKQHKCLCPFHDDRHPSLSFLVRRNTFHCFVCGASGGTIDLVMHCRRLGFVDACRWLSQAGGQSLTEVATAVAPSPRSEATSATDSTTFDAERYVHFFMRPMLNDVARRFLFDERRLDERVVRWCRLTSWQDHRGVHWLQIPYYDGDGRLVGVQQRNLSRTSAHEAGASQPRFRFPRGSRCGIYNLPVVGRLAQGEPLYITEGCSDCWAMLSAGHKAIAIPSATLLNRQDVELLTALHSRLATQFHMYPDQDAPGERLFLQLHDLLPCLTRHQLPSGCKDFGDYYASALVQQ